MNDATKLIANEAKSIVQAHLDRLGVPQEHQMSQQEKLDKFAQIKAELENRMLFWWRIIIVILKCKNWLN